MNVKLISSTVLPLNVCGDAAAICTDYADPLKALKGALASGHESVMEHASFTFRIQGVSRVLLAQLTRHRIASYSVQSQRYCRIDSAEFVVPPAINDNPAIHEYYNRRCHDCFVAYQRMIGSGIKEQDARYILPQGIVCQLIMTMNARELNHFLSLRMCNRAQWEIRNLADAMFEELYKTDARLLFDNAVPGCCTKRGCPQGKRSCKHPRVEQVEELKKVKSND